MVKNPRKRVGWRKKRIFLGFNIDVRTNWKDIGFQVNIVTELRACVQDSVLNPILKSYFVIGSVTADIGEFHRWAPELI